MQARVETWGGLERTTLGELFTWERMGGIRREAQNEEAKGVNETDVRYVQVGKKLRACRGECLREVGLGDHVGFVAAVSAWQGVGQGMVHENEALQREDGQRGLDVVVVGTRKGCMGSFVEPKKHRPDSEACG